MQTKKEELEQQYREIASLYDTAEELAGTVESEFAKNPEAQLKLVEPLIAQIADSADTLAEEFVTVLEKPAMAKSAKSRVESALRKIFMALNDYRSKMEARSEALAGVITNIADPIVDRIRKQAEKIVLIFMRLMELSLDRIMHKVEIEEFRRVNDRAMSGMPAVGH